jgi:DNA-directed RNA polymerase specialized sigma24 family protein
MMENCSDNELVMRLHIDDVKAFDALYLKYHQALYSNIFKLSKDADATQDILQEVFITLWEKRLTIVLRTSVGCLF